MLLLQAGLYCAGAPSTIGAVLCPVPCRDRGAGAGWGPSWEPSAEPGSSLGRRDVQEQVPDLPAAKSAFRRGMIWVLAQG